MTRPVDWPEGMTRYGVTVTREQMERAWKGWEPNTGYMGLALRLANTGELAPFVFYGHADAMIRRARKAGAIRLGQHVSGPGRRWEWAE